jgi:hypothetical protein
MKPLLRLLILISVFLAGPCTRFAQAQEAEVGKVLLLRNGEVMEGEIRRVGKLQILIRRGQSEIMISAARAARICADWDDAYAFAFSLIDPDDAGQRVKLARWCHTHGLNAQGLEQAKMALEMQPANAEAKLVVALLERASRPAAPMAPPMLPPVSAKEENTAPTVDVTPETMIGFSNRVQPILMNVCARCHAAGRGGDFVLERVMSTGQKVATKKNLARVLSYVDFERPAISPLLVKAVVIHGKADAAPLHSREAKAFQSMHEWILETIQRNPHLKDYREAHDARKPLPPPRFAGGVYDPASSRTETPPRTHLAPRDELRGPPQRPEPSVVKSLLVDPAASTPPQNVPPPRVEPSTAPPPAAVPTYDPNDPYSPEHFNRLTAYPHR